MSINKIAQASEWAFSTNPRFTFDDDKKTCSWTQTHSLGNADYLRYYTYKMALSATKYDLTKSFSSSPNNSIEPKFYDITKNSSPGSSTVTYTILMDDIIKFAVKHGITPQDVANDNAILYMNPVYQTYLGKYNEDNIKDKWIFGRQEILNAPGLDGGEWSGGPRDNFNDNNENTRYFNIPIRLSISNLYNVDIHSVDANGVDIADVIHIDKAMQGYPITHSALAEITKNEKKYTFNRWYFEYDKRGDNSASITAVNGDNKTSINFQGPDAEDSSTLEIYLELWL